MIEKNNNEAQDLRQKKFNNKLEQQVNSVFKIFKNYNKNENKDIKHKN